MSDGATGLESIREHPMLLAIDDAQGNELPQQRERAGARQRDFLLLGEHPEPGFNRCPGQKERCLCLARFQQTTSMSEMLFNLRRIEKRKLLPGEELFRRTESDQHELPARLSLDSLRKAADPARLRLSGRGLQLNDEPLVASTSNQVRPMVSEKRREIGAGGLDEHFVSLGSILLGYTLDLLPLAAWKVGGDQNASSPSNRESTMLT
jgi:hypothetical protein